MDWRFLTLAAQYDFLNRKFFNYLVGRKGIIKNGFSGIAIS
jgi:hypothetical protein